MTGVHAVLHIKLENAADAFAQEEWMPALKAHGLKHEDYPDANFFLTCANQVVRLHNDKELSDSTFNHSETLLKMLQRNLASYKAAESRPSEWDEINRSICVKPICVKTVSVYPYETRPGSRMVSLQDSVDYSHYRMVANAKVITSPTFNTRELRTALGLPAAPQAMDVITHLVQIAKSRNGQLRSLQVPPVGELDQRIQQDVHEAYSCIVKSVSHYLALPSEQPAELARMTQKLAAVPWVMDPHSQKFLKASELMFTIVEGDEQGKTSS